MTRITLIERDTGSEQIVRHGSNTSDLEMIEYALKTFGPAYKIKTITLTTVDAVHKNESSLEVLLKTTKKLTT